MNSSSKIITGLFISSLAFVQHGFAQADTSLQSYLGYFAQLVQSDGKWLTANKGFDTAFADSPSYFGFEFTKGINEHTFYEKRTPYVPKKCSWVVRAEGYYTWNPVKKKISYQSVYSNGTIASAESAKIGPAAITMMVTATPSYGASLKQDEFISLKADMLLTRSAGITQQWTRQELPQGNISFMSTRDGNFEIYSMSNRGENLRNLSCNKALDYGFSYSTGGRLVYYSNRDGNDEIYIMDAAGKKQTNISKSPSADRIPSASPDGKFIAFLSDRDEKDGDIYLMDTAGNNLVRLTNNKYFEDGPSWSPDSKRIIFTRELKDLKDSSKNAVGNGEIFVMDVDGKNEQQLTNRPGYDGGPQFSPDGKKIAFYGKTAAGNYDLFMMDADGGNIVNLTNDAFEDYSPSWSADGKWIAFTKGVAKNYDIWLINLATRIQTRLTSQPQRDESPFWQPVR